MPQPVPIEAVPTQSTQTPYGDSKQVQDYLDAINPYVQEVGKIQLEIDKMVGASGKATGANLGPAMEKGKPRLEQAIEGFSQITPPPLLAPLHGDIEKLMVLRLKGYETTISGWAQERQDGSTDQYEQAEATLREANQFILKLNSEMGRVHQALGAVESPSQTASP
jgi:hypothetical protein